MSKSIVLPCKCAHPYQDSVYGHGKRLHNIKKKETEARCTVCSSVHVIGGKTEVLSSDAKKGES